MNSFTILCGDARDVLATLPSGSVRCCVTSPPYWGLRDYGVAGQIGLEQTPEEYVEQLVAVFREVRRVLSDDGTLWLNLGDSYAAGKTGNGSFSDASSGLKTSTGLKPKDLVGIPWRVAFALQADGWWLRSDIIWHKPNPMPESVTDRPTKSHEYLFLLAKSERYFYDADAIAEPSTDSESLRGRSLRNGDRFEHEGGAFAATRNFASVPAGKKYLTHNRRSVWTITTKPYADAHFATFPPELCEPCILAGSEKGDTVLDPFAGSGTVGMVALKHGRSFIGVELNPEYAEMARKRITGDAPLFNQEAPPADKPQHVQLDMAVSS